MLPKERKSRKLLGNFRPISLLSLTSRIMDRNLLRRIKQEEEHIEIISNEPCGFREEHLTENQVMRMIGDLIINMENRRTICILFSNVEKAFDRIWQDGLISKMDKQGYKTTIIRTIQDYFTGRKFTIKISEIRSTEKRIRTGLNQ